MIAISISARYRATENGIKRFLFIPVKPGRRHLRPPKHVVGPEFSRAYAQLVMRSGERCATQPMTRSATVFWLRERAARERLVCELIQRMERR